MQRKSISYYHSVYSVFPESLMRDSSFKRMKFTETLELLLLQVAEIRGYLNKLKFYFFVAEIPHNPTNKLILFLVKFVALLGKVSFKIGKEDSYFKVVT